MKIKRAGLRRATELDGWEAVDIAARLEHLGGLVFFDTSGNVPKSAARPLSVISAAPAAIYKGDIRSAADVSELRKVLAENESPGGDRGLPTGGLCGWVDYEGGFVFGDFREMLVRDESSGDWWELGGLSEKMGETLPSGVSVGGFQEEMEKDAYIKAVCKVKEYIAAGDIYQVNVTRGCSAEVDGEGSLLGLYRVLRDATPAPMGAWLSLEGREILSTSPELFLKISGKGIETRPIKGTRPRFSDPDEDTRSAVELQTSPKEVAELVMITDLLRNDLGQVSEFGSVEAGEMLRLESLAQVHHLVSTVRGTLREGEDALSSLAACFPGGSITGAPKKRAMEIIGELEETPRGIYCGAIGWLGFNGESEFNIAIRTLVREGGKLRYQVGAGIVSDSVPEAEYEETCQKAAGILLGISRWRESRR